MKTAFGLFGLAVVLFAILLVGPFVKRFTEGFAEEATAIATAAPTATPAEEKASEELLEKRKKETEETKKLMDEIQQINTLLENPSLQPETKETMLKQKDNLNEQLKKVSGVAIPEDKVPVEGFEGSLPNNLAKNAALVSF